MCISILVKKTVLFKTRQIPEKVYGVYHFLFYSITKNKNVNFNRFTTIVNHHQSVGFWMKFDIYREFDLVFIIQNNFHFPFIYCYHKNIVWHISGNHKHNICHQQLNLLDPLIHDWKKIVLTSRQVAQYVFRCCRSLSNILSHNYLNRQF